MIPNIHQSIDEILKVALPQEKILWQQIRLLTGENAAVRQFFYCGKIALSEFLTYSANKLYLCSNFKAGHTNGPGQPNSPYVAFYDQSNNIFFYAGNTSNYWDSTAAAVRYCPNLVDMNNFYFSRLTSSVYTTIIFNGYKISY